MKIYDFKITTFLILFILSANLLSAQEKENEGEFEEVIQEFFVTESVYPQEKNEIQITNSDYVFFNDFGKDFYGGFELEYGITDRFQISSGIGYRFFDIDNSPNNLDGFTNLELGMLYNIYQSKTFSTSLSLEAELPTGSDYFGEDEIEFEPNLIVANQIGNFQSHINLGFAFGLEDDSESEMFYNIGILYPVNDKFVPILELNGIYEDDENNMQLTPGFAYKINRFEIGSGFPISLNSDNSYFGIMLDLVFEFGAGDDD